MNLTATVLLTGVGFFVLRRAVPGFLVQRAYSREDRGKLHSAEMDFCRALRWEVAIHAITGQSRGEALVCSSLGLLYYRQKRGKEAVVMLQRAIDGFSRTPDHLLEAAPVYGSLGSLYCEMGRLDEAESALRTALEIYKCDGGREAINETLRLLQTVQAQRG
jgi:tetratricopeptide (TPR) repeat protein